jgi:hypothetical protein
MKSIRHLSFITLAIITLFISFYRITHVSKKEISWDFLGYYLYLPATFIYHDPLLNDITWLEKINQEKDLTGTLYMVSTNDQGQPIYFFLMGMALFYLPFFFIGHFSAYIFGFPPDGFSLPYQYALVIGGIIYTIIGLIYLRKILKHFFSEGITSLVMLIIVFGTNYIHHLTLKNLETGTILFMLTSILIWHTILWHQNQKTRYLIVTGLCITLAGLVKPSEIFIFLLPLLWNVYSKSSFKEKLNLLSINRKSLFITLSISFLILLPQLSYWLIRTGHLFYDSYKNPGVGLDLLSPHFASVLFSFRKGWLLYTPVMVFALAGFYFLYKNNRKLFPALFIYFIVSFYIIASWSEWWYGSAFSIRPLITVYPVLAICLGYFLQEMQRKKTILKAILGSLLVLMLCLNQFQWWQLKNNILEPYRTTRAYYCATFLKTSVTDAEKELLLINRSFTGTTAFEHPEKYTPSILKQQYSFNDIKSYYTLSPDQEYFPFCEQPYNTLTANDHIFLVATLDIRFPKDFSASLPCLVMTMERKQGVYGYLAPEIKTDTPNGEWHTFKLTYLTPEIRNTHDHFKCYIWKRSKSSFDIRNLKLERFERKGKQ